MKITVDKIFKVNNESKMKGSASVIIDDCFKITGIKIIEGTNGLFLSMPSRKLPDGTMRDIAYPINTETREMFNEVILKAYEEDED